MGNWLDKDHSLPAIKNWIWGQFQALKGGTRIVANTDLNTIFDTGNYYCDSNTTAQSLAHIPLAASSMHAFTMKVGYATGVGYLYQELIDYYTGVRYYRYHDSYTQGDTDTTKWKDWKAFAQNSNTIPSGYCTTAAGTAAKTASCTNYQLKTNSYLHVLISNTNTAASALTLNVNGKGAKPIWINGNASSSSNHTLPAGTYIVFYDGTNYYFNTESGLSDHLLPWGHKKTRRTTANIPSDNSGGLETFMASSSMTEGKPMGDGNIIHMNWDNSGKYATQLAIMNGTGKISSRSQHLNGGVDWGDWRIAAMFGEGVKTTGGKAVITGSSYGEVVETDLAGAVEGSPTEIKRRGAFVAQSSNGGASKPWYKVAEVTVTAKSQDREITFYVEDTMASAGNKYFMQGRNGILHVRCRTNENDSFGDSTITSGGESTYLTWLSNCGYFGLSFALAVKVTLGESVVYELWTRIDYNYNGRRFIVLSEGKRTDKEQENWTLYDTWTNGSQASLPSGYDYIYSNISAQSAQRLVDEDLDNIKFANGTAYGVAYFYAEGSNTVANIPSDWGAGSAFGLELRKTAGNVCVQEIWSPAGTSRYCRRWDGGSSSNNWTAWTKMPTSFASPEFTGTPTAPTPATSSNDTQIANTSFVKTVVNNAINGIFIGENLYQPFIQSEGTNTAATAGTSATVVPLITKKYDYDPNESFEVLSDGGLKVKTSGLFKITGAAMIKPNNNGNTTNLGVYIYISKSGTETEEEVTLQSPGSSTLARVVTIGPKIISLESDDIVYLKSRCIGAAGTVDTTKSYLLIEQSFLHYEEVIPGTFGS